MSRTKTPSSAFFSSVRTDSKLKKKTEQVLAGLGLSWSAFVNHVAKKLVHEKKIIFELHDEAGFTKEKGRELQAALKEIETGKNITRPMKIKTAQRYLQSR